MAHLAQIILIEVGGYKRLYFPLDSSTLFLHSPALPSASFLPIFQMVYRGEFPSRQALSHYFPGENSWIIFELKGDKHPFMVAFGRFDKSLGAYFLSGTFEEEIFFEEGIARRADSLIALFNSHQWDHSEFVRDKETYRRLLFGQEGGKKLKRFTWTSEKKYADLLRLLAGDKSNFSLADGLLDTLLFSSGKGHTEINLKSLRDQLKDFEQARRDLEFYKNKKENIEELLRIDVEISQLTGRRQELIREGFSAENFLKEERLRILEQHKVNKHQLSILQDQLSRTESAFNDNWEGLTKSLGYAEERLSQAREKENKYQGKKTSSKKSGSKGKEASEWLLKRERWLGIQKQELLDKHINRTLELKEEALEKLEKIQAEREAHLESYLGTKEEIATWEAYQKALSTPASVRTEDTAPDETSRLHLQEQLESLEQQRKQELELNSLRVEKGEIQLEARLLPHQHRLKQLNQWLENRSNSFYGWLEDRYPGWQKTIGKVVKEDVLFQSGLNPSVVRLNDLLYGIQLSIGEIERKAPSLEELKQERQETEAEIEKLRESHQDFVEEQEKQRQNIDKRYKQRIRQLRSELQQIEIQREQAELRKKKAAVASKVQSRGQQQEVQQKLLKLQYEEVANEKQLEELRVREVSMFEELQRDMEQSRERVEEELNQLSTAFEKENKSFEFEKIEDEEAYLLDRLAHIEQIPHFEREVKELETRRQQLKIENEEEHQRQKDAFEVLESKVLETHRELDQIEAQLEDWKKYKDEQKLKAPAQANSTTAFEEARDLSTLGTRLNRLDEEENILSGRINILAREFLHHFSEGNIFTFPSFEEKDALALMLKKLRTLEEEGLEEGLAQRFSSLVGRVAEQTRVLVELEHVLKGELPKLESYLAALLPSGLNFRVDIHPASHPLLGVLKQIGALNEREGEALGGVSLFNAAPDSATNQEALKLLASLSLELNGISSRYLRGTEAFDLSILIKSDDSGAGWVDIKRLPESLSAWTSAWLRGAGLRHLKEIFPEFPMYLFFEDIDKLGPGYASQWVEGLQVADIKVISSSQFGAGAEKFGRVWIEDGKTWKN